MSGKRRRRRSKKAYEQLERKEAQRKLDARSESEDRQERIKVLWDAITSGELARDAKELADSELVRSLVELVELQKREIQYLTQFRRDWEEIHAHYPGQLENLSTASFRAAWQPLFEKLLAEQKPKEVWEYKRRGYKLPGGVGLIEYEFGGAGEEWWKHSLSGGLGSAYEPTCLDNIFASGTLRMRSEDVALNPQPSGPLAPFLSKTQHKAGLEELFGMERHRFGTGLRSIKKGREEWYDYRAVVKIMHRLLSEEPREDKKPRRGKKVRLWPGNPGLRIQVLIGIHKRMECVSVSDDIWGAFTAVVCHHLVKGIEERLSEDVKDAVAALVRRHLG